MSAPAPPPPQRRPTGQLLVVAGLAGALGAGLAEADLAPAWAVLVGAATGLAATTPVLPRAVALLVGSLAGWGVASAGTGLGGELGILAGVLTGGLVLGAALIARLSGGRVAVWPVILGAAAVLAVPGRGAAAGAADVVETLAGLAAGLVAVAVGEATTAWRRRRHRRAPDDRAEPVPSRGTTESDEEHV